MVDAVVSFVVQRVGEYLKNEAVFLRGVRGEVESVKKELEWMNCFIKDAEEKQVDSPLIKQWVSDIREIAYDFEDVLDEFTLQVHDKDEEGESSERKHGLFTAIKKSVAKSSRKGREKLTTYNIGKKIESLKKGLNDVSQRCELYGLRDINIKRDEDCHAFRRMKQLRKTTSFSFEEKVVGYEDETNKLLAKLLADEPRRYVISIWGTGGLGKTTLAGKLYKSSAIKHKFDCCAWVSVSQHFNIEDLLLRIIKSFGFPAKKLKGMSEEDLERYVHESLQGRSYLVVIDDVWHKEAWASLKRAFPDNENGSRVIITTRIKDVAERSDERTYVHELRFLKPDESWQLFCDKAFWNLSIDEGLERLGREMVEKCRGLPLAIVVLGGLLSTKKPQEWNLVRDNIWQNLSNDSIQITYLLALSFNDLPYKLKLCFLYLSHFPEDYAIDTDKLIRLWLAEGYIPHNEEIMEDVARNYLNELINRSLIQKEKTWLGKVVTCRIHDLLRDLSIQKATELNFIHSYDEIRRSSTHSSMLSCRRQAIYSGMNGIAWLQQCNPLLRSLLIFFLKQEGAMMSQLVSNLCTTFRFLRVLEFQHYRNTQSSWCLPKDIDKLIHLKYLGLRDTLIYSIPESILNLSNLETLDLNDDPFCCLYLPTEICKLKNLRHLIGELRGQYLRIDNMTNLQTLISVQDDTWTQTNHESLVNLRKLHLCLNRESQRNFTFDSIAKLKSIQILWVDLSKNHFFSTLQPLSHCPHLRDLSLCGKIEKLPEDMPVLLPNIEHLSLQSSELVDDPMPVLEKMLNLTVLALRHGCYCGKKMVCRANSFPRVEILTIETLYLEEWQVEEGALPVLTGLELINHRQQFQLPERLKSVPRLG
ncbi:putative disease resistance RPP13-like protein 3 [Mangifera indica]|uniref:putative disease resistance RPP13-like protein 3 n=1 Tax=Mangifera indica TaxID=29780 RepID=UPI001CFB36D3|nr:putative disease resistance RPP13-like protein 3 [Mangifera indica]